MNSIIIVDYNSIEETLKYIERCIESINEVDEMAFVVVDNSDDGNCAICLERTGDKTFVDVEIEDSEQQIKKHKFEKYNVFELSYNSRPLYIIEARENLGYAKGNNLGIRFSKEILDSSYCIISNNDIFFTNRINVSDFIDICQKESNIAVVGPKIIDPNGNSQSPYQYLDINELIVNDFFHMAFGKLIKSFKPSVMASVESGECYFTSGSFLFIDIDRFLGVDGFDGGTFLYCEEMILSERLKQKGYCFYFFDKYELIHKHSTTMKSNMSELKRLERYWESAFYYFEKYKGVSKAEINNVKMKLAFAKPFYIMRRYIKHIIKG